MYFVCVGSLFCGAVLCVGSSFAIISLRKRKLVALSRCRVAVGVLFVFLAVSYTYLLFGVNMETCPSRPRYR